MLQRILTALTSKAAIAAAVGILAAGAAATAAPALVNDSRPDDGSAQLQAQTEDDDVEAHSPPIGPSPSIGPEPSIGP